MVLPFSTRRDRLPRRRERDVLRRLAVSLGMVTSLALGGCVTDRGDVTGSIAPAAPKSDTDKRGDAEQWGARYRADPTNKVAALNYARALRALTQYNQAVAVLENVAIKAPYDYEVLAAYGKALADAGRFKEAADVLSRAHTPENPNWSVLSSQGSVADQLGDHVQAQSYYDAALKIRPGDPGVLTNLGLSYALSNKLDVAENTIRQAARQPSADMRVRQDLALVLALEGKFGEAEQIAEVDLSPADAKASIASISAMIAQSNTWSQIQKGGGSHGRKPMRLSAAQAQ